MKKIKLYKLIAAVLTVVLLVFSCTSQAFASSEDDTGKALTAGVFTDRCPIFYIDCETDEIVGIGADLMRFAAESAGFTVTFKQIEEGSMKDALDNEAYDVVLPFGSAVPSSSGKPTVVSDNLFQTPFTVVTKGSHNLEDLNNIRVGMLQSLAGVSETVKELYPGIQITFYETMAESVDALRAGKVDALMNNSYNWSYVLQKPSYSDLVVHPSTMFSMDFCVGAADTPENRELIEQLNKGIAMLTDMRRQAIILDYTSRQIYRYDFEDYLYRYWLSILLVTLLIVFTIMIAIQRKVVLNRQHEEKLRRLIDEDSLTGALSLKGFRKRVTELMIDHSDMRFLILYLNISNFKYINDRVGMEAGDDVLRFLVEKTKEVLGDEEEICRLEGDHFAVLRRISTEEILHQEYEKVVNAVRTYFSDRGEEVLVQIYSGIYVLTAEDYEKINVDHMIDLARVAEKRVRGSIRKEGYEFYNPEQWVRGMRKSEIISHLPAAISSGEIKVWYQPQYNYNMGKINGAEALCRWNHPKLGWISPSEFIPALEESGLIRELDFFVWETVCKDLKKWNDEGMKRSVSVNLSRNDIIQGSSICEHFCELIRKYDLDPSQLRIEITETVYTEDPEILINTTKELRAAGFYVEMDDFGSGYSSLNILKEVPVDSIKLDLLFLRESDYPEKSRTIISYIVQMVQALGMDMIAEGVETKEQAKFLQSQGCSEMQGYYFYKPLPLQDFEKAFEKK